MERYLHIGFKVARSGDDVDGGVSMKGDSVVDFFCNTKVFCKLMQGS
jgi:hypothetical protein